LARQDCDALRGGTARARVVHLRGERGQGEERERHRGGDAPPNRCQRRLEQLVREDVVDRAVVAQVYLVGDNESLVGFGVRAQDLRVDADDQEAPGFDHTYVAQQLRTARDVDVVDGQDRVVEIVGRRTCGPSGSGAEQR